MPAIPRLGKQARAEARAVQLREAGVRAIFDHSTIGQAVVDPSGQVLASNEAYDRMVAGGAGEAMRSALSSAATADGPVELECTGRLGREWWARLTVGP